MTTAQLAALVLQVLDAQRSYFQAKPGTATKGDLLRECMRREAHLRKVCREITDPAKVKPGLFENSPTTRMPD